MRPPLLALALVACDPGESSSSGYDACDGNPFISNDCEDGACAAELGATGLELDLRGLDFENVSGTFTGDGSGDIDGETCAEAVVDLETADLIDCDTTPCFIE